MLRRTASARKEADDPNVRQLEPPGRVAATGERAAAGGVKSLESGAQLTRNRTIGWHRHAQGSRRQSDHADVLPVMSKNRTTCRNASFKTIPLEACRADAWSVQIAAFLTLRIALRFIVRRYSPLSSARCREREPGEGATAWLTSPHC